MTNKLYANVDIECMTEVINEQLISGEVREIRYTPQYRATITIDFNGDIPDYIRDIMRKGMSNDNLQPPRSPRRSCRR